MEDQGTDGTTVVIDLTGIGLEGVEWIDMAQDRDK